ncbi:hypothetical protein OG204_30495 [Streptomyces sp. NBC_01387]|uniref:hypothetical protein n=1 Tax=unclassified Streptomyces TaxID=2593676 RepID=UPI0020242157|nr:MULTISPECIES: hypothetical protein [unclassified Streptomyces]MCX4547306.1 hypothetical protein [Streptomyces sp. NBC_01500]WSC19033.1 hypothetical protein OIE60_04775 [Streptomyces sp. NBC_01766]WSV53056.1 hypothetical protein OG282_04725 [Streptomyces sp. NBC_01014]
MIITKRHSLRIAAVSTLAAATVALAGTAAMADSSPAPSATVAQQTVAAKATITAKPSVSSVKAWQLFRVTGTTTGLKAGSKVTLQQKQGAKWVTLPASAPVNRNGSYSLRVELGIKGKNQLRIVSGSTASPVFYVTVR